MQADKEYLMKLTDALYRVTGLFPQEEPLKKRIRQEGLRVLAYAVTLFSDPPLIFKEGEKDILRRQVLEGIAALDVYFELAQKQNWLDRVNFAILSNAYGKLKEEISERINQMPNSSSGDSRQAKSAGTESKPQEEGRGGGRIKPLRIDWSALKNKRHKKIISILQKKNKAQVKDLQVYFPQTSKRTLRRDMGYLVENGFLKRAGDRNDTFYQIVR